MASCWTRCARPWAGGAARRRHRYRWMNGVAAARRRRRARRQLAGGRDRQARRQGDLPQQLRHRPCRHARHRPPPSPPCGRARWKIENETFNVLKTNGYNLEHNFGHGSQTLASILVVLQSAGLRPAHGLRPDRSILAAGAARTRSPKAPVRAHPPRSPPTMSSRHGGPHENRHHGPPPSRKRLIPGPRAKPIPQPQNRQKTNTKGRNATKNAIRRIAAPWVDPLIFDVYTECASMAVSSRCQSLRFGRL